MEVRIRLAITKAEQLDVTPIATDNHCELGNWQHGEANSRYGKLRPYVDCVGKCAAFHREAAPVAQPSNAKAAPRPRP